MQNELEEHRPYQEKTRNMALVVTVCTDAQRWYMTLYYDTCLCLLCEVKQCILILITFVAPCIPEVIASFYPLDLYRQVVRDRDSGPVVHV